MNKYEGLFRVRKRVGKRLFEIMKNKGYGKVALAKEAGISRPTLNNLFEGNINSITTFGKHIDKVCEVLETDAQALLEDEGQCNFIKLPIGVDLFDKLIETGQYYVDKTLLIKELLERGAEVNLITRPRRFGKTLNLSMLRCFFEGSDKDLTELFSGTNIMQPENAVYLKHMGQYPVIFLTLKSMKQVNFKTAFAHFQFEISMEYSRHSEVMSRLQREQDKEKYLQFLRSEASLEEYGHAIRFLSQCLQEVYGRKVIILMDEYDVPLESAYFYGYYDEMIPLIRSLFETAFKTNPSLAFAVITGCLRISRESIFTGMNNLKMVSIASHEFSEYFGFTQEEVDRMLEEYDLVENRNLVKNWYNGYKFGNTEVYNPWSVINYVASACVQKDVFPNPYWANTSSNSIVHSLVECADFRTKQEIEDLLEGKTIIKPIHEDVTYEDMNSTQENLWNFLFFTGYLKKVREVHREDEKFIELAIPNKEVKYIYRRTIRRWFEEQVKQKDLTIFYQAVLSGNEEVFEKELRARLREGISFFDSKESFYHGFLMGLLYGIGEYVVESNRESGDGRYDICVRSYELEKPVMLIEVKQASNVSELEEKAEAALVQIKDKRYQEALAYEGYREILCYGIGFYRKNCKVVMERVRI